MKNEMHLCNNKNATALENNSTSPDSYVGVGDD
jgi:hypothetical protein